MIRLTLLMFIIVGPVMAGIAVLIATAAPQLGLYSMSSMGWVALVGFVLGLPLSLLFASMLPKDLLKA